MAEGNKQDISVHDKNNAALAATKEAQDMSTLDRVVVPMPQFVNPNNPDTNAGSINHSLESHPAEHAADYGAGLATHVVQSPMDNLQDKPEGEWTKDDYKERLGAVGQPVSGNKEELQKRWTAFQKQEELYADYSAEDWKADIENADSENDLASLKTAYERSGADFSTVESAFDDKSAELSS